MVVFTLVGGGDIMLLGIFGSLEYTGRHVVILLFVISHGSWFWPNVVQQSLFSK